MTQGALDAAAGAPASRAAAFAPRGHPVRRFVLALAALSVACAALWWSGAAAPRVAASAAPARATPAGRGAGVTLRVHNAAPLAVEVVRGRIVGDPRVRVAAVALDGHDVAARPAPLPGFAEGRLTVRLAVACARPVRYGRDPDDRLVLTLRTRLAGDRRRAVATLDRHVAAICRRPPIRR